MEKVQYQSDEGNDLNRQTVNDVLGKVQPAANRSRCMLQANGTILG